MPVMVAAFMGIKNEKAKATNETDFATFFSELTGELPPI